MPATFHRGQGGSVLAGSVAFAVLDWTLTKTNRLTEITNSGSLGYAEYFPGVTEGSGSFNALWDSENIPDEGNTENASPGDPLFGPDESGTLEVGALVVLTLKIGDSGKTYVMNARIESLAVTVNAVTDVVKFACNFKTSGVITDPT